ncbi:DUF1877 family protein [Embleya scabrispora]|uniref:DUF1877 family protein n=1 Tax=Embleya scabrispora TaxID=159449 RepID=UPI00036019DB|nr:DUF1877 family protein [Embleya scabrispora]MYS87546.1 DUF1877 family protein [Streptomyces sp. SID5474]
MGGRGVLFAVEEGDGARLLGAVDDTGVMAVVEEVEERWERGWLVELDKAWDALHRCLTDGTLTYDGGEYPLSHAILGGYLLHEGDEYVVSYATPDEVRAVAAALARLDAEWVRGRFEVLEFVEYDGTAGEDDIAYTQAFLPDLRDFYRCAADAGRAVIFTVDP